MLLYIILFFLLLLLLVYCLQTFCQLVCDGCGYRFCHPGISRFVAEYLDGGSRLKIPPYFLLLQNPQVSLHYYLCLNAGHVFLSILSKFLLSQFCHLNLPVALQYQQRDVCHMLLSFTDKRLPLLFRPFPYRSVFIYKT